jgi:hypothetical protein
MRIIGSLWGTAASGDDNVVTIRSLLDSTPVDGSDEETVKQMDAVMR